MNKNIQEWLLIIVFSLVTIWVVERIFFNKSSTPEHDGSVKPGQSFIAPKSKQELKPLNVEVDFIDTKRLTPEVSTEVDTDHALFVFSSDGASLERLEFKHKQDGWPHSLTTIFPVPSTDREKRCFLVGLPEDTPYYYTLLAHRHTSDAVILVYEATTKQATIRKEFVVYKHLYKVDMVLTIQPHQSGINLEPRIFYPAPLLPEIAAEDVKSAIISDEQGKVITIPRAKLETGRGWFAPTLVGVEDRYFVYALIDDPQKFVQRAYYKLTDQNNLYAILEGQQPEQATSWTISFYMGPKEQGAMDAVDPRLEKTLGYAGWFAPIALWLLRLLDFLYRYLGNYGVAIIVLTIIVKLVLLPFSLKGAQGMKRQAEVQRKLKYLQQRHKDEPEILIKERTELMRKEGLSTFTGCLPSLLQLPVFFALNRVLATSIQLYQAPFIWINDLSAPDPYYIFPILIILTMLAQSTTVEPQQRTQLIIMAVIIGVVSTGFSAGVCLYVFMSFMLGVVQSLFQRTLAL